LTLDWNFHLFSEDALQLLKYRLGIMLLLVFFGRFKHTLLFVLGHLPTAKEEKTRIKHFQ
jgi:hypothetical protein